MPPRRRTKAAAEAPTTTTTPPVEEQEDENLQRYSNISFAATPVAVRASGSGLSRTTLAGDAEEFSHLATPRPSYVAKDDHDGENDEEGAPADRERTAPHTASRSRASPSTTSPASARRPTAAAHGESARRSPRAASPYFHHIESMRPLRVQVGVVPLPCAAHRQRGRFSLSPSRSLRRSSRDGSPLMQNSSMTSEVPSTTTTTTTTTAATGVRRWLSLTQHVASRWLPLRRARDGEMMAAAAQDGGDVSRSSATPTRQASTNSFNVGDDDDDQLHTERLLHPKKFFQLPVSANGEILRQSSNSLLHHATRAGSNDEGVDIVGWDGVFCGLPMHLPGSSPSVEGTKVSEGHRKRVRDHELTCPARTTLGAASVTIILEP